MPKRKEAEQFAMLGEKDCWNLYGLQVLSPNKFAIIVGKILSGQYSAIRPRAGVHASTEQVSPSG